MPDSISTFTWSRHAPNDHRAYVMRLAPQEPVGPHDHLFHEIAMIDRGSATHVTVDGRAKLRAGDLIVLRPQVWHAYESPTADFSVTNCLIHPALLQQLLPLVGTAMSTFELFWRRRPQDKPTGPAVMRLAKEDRQDIVQYLDHLEREQRGGSPECQAAVTGIGLALLARVARAWSDGRPPPARLMSPRAESAVLRASAYLESHLRHPPSLAELARHVGMTAPHLSRCFAKRMGGGVVSFVHRLRAEEACRLLRLTDLSVTEIAQRLGYDEIAYFSRRFRVYAGRSPRQYRNSASFEAMHDDAKGIAAGR